MVQAQDFYLPAPGIMVHLSPEFNPPILKGIKVHSDNPFRFDFILDQGNSPSLLQRGGQGELKQEATRLIKYFLASLTIPENDLWVNLSPYEKNRIIPQSFGLTEMGRDLLAEDYMLKQITASLIYPEDEIGKKFWKRIYEEAAKKFGTTNIPVNTFNKVWIVPAKAVVYENAKAGTAYVVESKLKVMLEQDYLALEKHQRQPGDMALAVSSSTLPNEPSTEGESIPGKPRFDVPTTSKMASQIIRQIVIPELTKEVNEGKNFSQLRQVYNSLILATWYKKKIKDSLLAQVFANKSKTKGLSFPNASIGNPEHIYQQYLKAFKKGVYNYIKEETDPLTQEIIPRKYFSGGMLIGPNRAMVVTQRVPNGFHHNGDLAMITCRLDAVMASARHYRDKLKRLNPRYRLWLINILEYSNWRVPTSTETYPMREEGLDELLSAYNKETLNQRLEVLMLGAGLLEHPKGVFTSPQTVEVVGHLSSGRAGKLDLTIVDQSRNVLKIATRKNQRYVNASIKDHKYVTTPISAPVAEMVKSQRVIAGENISNVALPSNTIVKGFAGSFEDLTTYGIDQVDLILATNSLGYAYAGLGRDNDAYLELVLRLITALKPKGKLLIDRFFLSPFIPEMAIDRVGLIINESETERFEVQVEHFEKYIHDYFGVDIRLRFYKKIVEIEKLPASSIVAGSRIVDVDTAQLVSQHSDRAMAAGLPSVDEFIQHCEKLNVSQKQIAAVVQKAGTPLEIGFIFVRKGWLDVPEDFFDNNKNNIKFLEFVKELIERIRSDFRVSQENVIERNEYYGIKEFRKYPWKIIGVTHGLVFPEFYSGLEIINKLQRHLHNDFLLTEQDLGYAYHLNEGYFDMKDHEFELMTYWGINVGHDPKPIGLQLLLLGSFSLFLKLLRIAASHFFPRDPIVFAMEKMFLILFLPGAVVVELIAKIVLDCLTKSLPLEKRPGGFIEFDFESEVHDRMKFFGEVLTGTTNKTKTDAYQTSDFKKTLYRSFFMSYAFKFMYHLWHHHLTHRELSWEDVGRACMPQILMLVKNRVKAQRILNDMINYLSSIEKQNSDPSHQLQFVSLVGWSHLLDMEYFEDNPLLFESIQRGIGKGVLFDTVYYEAKLREQYGFPAKQKKGAVNAAMTINFEDISERLFFGTNEKNPGDVPPLVGQGSDHVIRQDGDEDGKDLQESQLAKAQAEEPVSVTLLNIKNGGPSVNLEFSYVPKWSYYAVYVSVVDEHTGSLRPAGNFELWFFEDIRVIKTAKFFPIGMDGSKTYKIYNGQNITNTILNWLAWEAHTNGWNIRNNGTKNLPLIHLFSKYFGGDQARRLLDYETPHGKDVKTESKATFVGLVQKYGFYGYQIMGSVFDRETHVGIKLKKVKGTISRYKVIATGIHYVANEFRVNSIVEIGKYGDVSLVEDAGGTMLIKPTKFTIGFSENSIALQGPPIFSKVPQEKIVDTAQLSGQGENRATPVNIEGRKPGDVEDKRTNGPGGIDLTRANMNLQTNVMDSRFRGNDSRDSNNNVGIKFHLDPAKLAEFQNAPGFVPVVINIQPLKSLSSFLGVNQASS